jgi:hypothetical protein
VFVFLCILLIASLTTLLCSFLFLFLKGCTTRKFFVTVAEQTSEETDAAQLCYDQEGGLKGVPFGVYIVEGSVYQYKVHLELEPPQGVNVLLQVKTNEPRCQITGTEHSFTVDNWNEEHTITIQTSDDGIFTAKDTISLTCIVEHKIESDDGAIIAASPLVLDVRSPGCGLGEHLRKGDDDRTHCVCNPSYFFPKSDKCTKCPFGESTCDEIGLTAL